MPPIEIPLSETFLIMYSLSTLNRKGNKMLCRISFPDLNKLEITLFIFTMSFLFRYRFAMITIDNHIFTPISKDIPIAHNQKLWGSQ